MSAFESLKNFGANFQSGLSYTDNLARRNYSFYAGLVFAVIAAMFVLYAEFGTDIDGFFAQNVEYETFAYWANNAYNYAIGAGVLAVLCGATAYYFNTKVSGTRSFVNDTMTSAFNEMPKLRSSVSDSEITGGVNNPFYMA